MSYSVTSDEYLEVDASSTGHAGDWLPLHTPAWVLTGITDLWQRAKKRGGDGVRIPGAHGARGTPAWRDQTEFVLPIEVFGDREPDGTPIAGARAGLEENLLILQDLEDKPANDYGTRAAQLHRPSGIWVADIIVMRLTFGAHSPMAVKGALTMSIPAGEFVPDPGSI